MLTRVALFALLLVPLPDGLASPQAQQEDGSKETAFKTETSLVSLEVTVTDKKGQPIDGLARNDFRVYEDNTEQNVTFFSRDKKPVSWGLVLDRSGSMTGMMEDVYRAALHSVEAGTPEDETFIMTFNQDIDVVQDFTSDRDKLLRSIRNISATGSTALYDAVALSLDHMRQGRHQKKVLVVITDGDDNASHIRFTRLLEMAKKSETLVYIVGFFEAMDLPNLKLLGRQSSDELKRLAEQTGGIAYFPKGMQECDRACKDIALQVSRQYSLGYYPKNIEWDGRWREIRVAVNRPEKAMVRTRAGYFGRDSERVERLEHKSVRLGSQMGGR